MSYTRNQLQTLLSQRLGDHITATATGGAAAGATITSTDLLRQPGARYAHMYCEIVTTTDEAAPQGEVRLINTATVSSGVITLTPYNPYTVVMTSGDTIALHRFDPVWKQEAINEVLRELAAHLPVTVSEELITGECLRNGHMEFWRDGSNAYDWILAAGTLARQATTVYRGRYSLGLTGVASAGNVYQRIHLGKELAGVAMTLRAWVYGTGDAGIYIRLEDSNGGASSTALVANNTWTQLTVSRTPAVAQGISDYMVARLYNTSGVICYYDEADLLVPTTANSSVDWIPLSEYYTKLYRCQLGWLQSTTTKTTVGKFLNHSMPERYERGYAWFGQDIRLQVPYWFRLIGTGRYPNLTAGTDEVEVNQEEARLIACMAAMKLLDKAEGYEHPIGKEWIEQKRKDVAIELAELKATVYRPVPNLYLPVPIR